MAVELVTLTAEGYGFMMVDVTSSGCTSDCVNSESSNMSEIKVDSGGFDVGEDVDMMGYVKCEKRAGGVTWLHIWYFYRGVM